MVLVCNTNHDNSKHDAQGVPSEHITPMVLEVSDPGERGEPAQHHDSKLKGVAECPRALPGHPTFQVHLKEEDDGLDGGT